MVSPSTHLRLLMPPPLSSSPANLCKRLTSSLMPAVQVTITVMLAKNKNPDLACHTCLAALLVCMQPANVPILSALHDAWLCKIRLFFFLRVCCNALGACTFHQSDIVVILKWPTASAMQTVQHSGLQHLQVLTAMQRSCNRL